MCIARIVRIGEAIALGGELGAVMLLGVFYLFAHVKKRKISKGMEERLVNKHLSVRVCA